MSEPITNLADAVAALGALPMPVGNEPRATNAEECGAPQPLTTEREAEIREWRDELGARKDFASVGPYCALHDALAEIDRLRAERQSTNEALTEAAETLRENRDRIAELDTNLAGWWKRGRAAEDDLRSARIRVAELEARAVAGPDTVWWLAQYEGVEPELFATEAAAREFCDDQAAGEVNQWDWFPDGDGVWQQVETSDLDDRPLTATPGSVRRLSPGQTAHALPESGGAS